MPVAGGSRPVGQSVRSQRFERSLFRHRTGQKQAVANQKLPSIAAIPYLLQVLRKESFRGSSTR
jgi:hypothetical protein